MGANSSHSGAALKSLLSIRTAKNAVEKCHEHAKLIERARGTPLMGLLQNILVEMDQCQTLINDMLSDEDHMPNVHVQLGVVPLQHTHDAKYKAIKQECETQMPQQKVICYRREEVFSPQGHTSDEKLAELQQCDLVLLVDEKCDDEHDLENITRQLEGSVELARPSHGPFVAHLMCRDDWRCVFDQERDGDLSPTVPFNKTELHGPFFSRWLDFMINQVGQAKRRSRSLSEHGKSVVSDHRINTTQNLVLEEDESPKSTVIRAVFMNTAKDNTIVEDCICNHFVKTYQDQWDTEENLFFDWKKEMERDENFDPHVVFLFVPTRIDDSITRRYQKTVGRDVSSKKMIILSSDPNMILGVRHLPFCAGVVRLEKNGNGYRVSIDDDHVVGFMLRQWFNVPRKRRNNEVVNVDRTAVC